MPRVSLHEETSIAVPAIDLASRVWIDAVVEDPGLVEDAFEKVLENWEAFRLRGST